jgi:hypothetical protein
MDDHAAQPAKGRVLTGWRCRKEIGGRRWPWLRPDVKIICEVQLDGADEWTLLFWYVV